MTPPRAHLYLPHVSFYYHNLPECQALPDSGYHKKVLSHVIQSDSYPPEKTLIYDTGLRHWFTTLVYNLGLWTGLRHRLKHRQRTDQTRKLEQRLKSGLQPTRAFNPEEQHYFPQLKAT